MRIEVRCADTNLFVAQAHPSRVLVDQFLEFVQLPRWGTDCVLGHDDDAVDSRTRAMREEERKGKGI